MSMYRAKKHSYTYSILKNRGCHATYRAKNLNTQSHVIKIRGTCNYRQRQAIAIIFRVGSVIHHQLGPRLVNFATIV